MTPVDQEKLLALGGGNAGCSGLAGFSTACVSVPSGGSLMTLLDGSKPPMLAMYNNMAAAVMATAEAVNATAYVRFNTELCVHCISYQASFIFCSNSYLENYSMYGVSY